MPLLNIVCPICTDAFKNADDVYSTSCGHLFHFTCLNDWRSRGSSCPQCRHYNPTYHKLYLSFDDLEENSPALEDLTLKLTTSNERNTELLVQKNEAETNFMRIQEQFTAIENVNKELEGRVIELNSFEQDFMNIQKQYTESTEHIHELKCRVEQLSIETERKTKELSLKTLENESLKTSLDAGQIDMPDNVLAAKIKILEQKLNHITKEFEKEINISTQLSIEKMKLESLVQNLRSVGENSKKLEINQKNKNLNPNPRNRKKRNDIKKGSLDNPHQFEDDNSKINSIIIKDLPLEHVILPLENIVIRLAEKMNLTISGDDLLKVNFLKNKDENYTKTQMFVQFKNKDIKNKFFLNKNALKNDLTTNGIKICQYIDDELNSLLIYAKDKLRNIGYRNIYCKNNKILASKRQDRRGALLLENKTEVDNLADTKKSDVDTVPKTPSYVDENLYQI